MANPFAVAAHQLRSTPMRRRGDTAWGPSGNGLAAVAGGRLHAWDWALPRLSINQLLRGAIAEARDRARELVVNHSAATPIPKIFAENVVGKDGITLQALVKTSRDAYNQAVNERIETAWYRWAEPRHCTVERRLAWLDVETMCAELEPVDGEVLIRILPGFDNAFGFALEPLDPDQLDHKLNREAAPGRNAIVMGVEIDRWGGPVAYYLHANHPSETSRTNRHVVVPADDMIHLFAAMRPKQVRGLTWFAPVVLDLRMLAGYREAELVAARAGASKVGFLTAKDPDAQYLETGDGDEGAEDLGGRQQVVWEAEPGTIEQLPPGMEFHGWDPQHPNSGFDAFDKAILRGVAAATRISYMSLTGDLNGTTYGSGRMGMLAERQVFQKLQQRLVAHVHDRVYDRWLPEALLSGQLALDSFNVDRYRARAWHPRPFPWIDPVKDIDAAAREVRMGVNTLTRIAAERGRDFAELVRERAHEQALLEAAGVTSDLTSNGQPQASADDETPPARPNDRTTDARAGAHRPRLLIGGR